MRNYSEADPADYWDEFLKSKVALWYAHNEWCHRICFTITEFLGMTSVEYGDWVVYGEASTRVMRVWKSNFESWKRRVDEQG